MTTDARLTVLRYLQGLNDWLAPQLAEGCDYGYCYAQISDLLGCTPGDEVATLAHLATNKYLDTRHVDKIHLCPACSHYNLNFREVCTSCGSSNIAPTTHIHHFACGYIAPERDFRRGLDYVCPKCNKTLRHIGVDYEEPSSPFVCSDCATAFDVADVSCTCLHCEARFDAQGAVKHTIFSYRINAQGINAVATGKLHERDGELYDPEFPVYNENAFADHLRQLFNNSMRYGTALACMQFSFAPEDSPAQRVDTNNLNDWLRQAILRICQALRSADIVGLLTPNRLAILMPGTGLDNLEAVRDKLEAVLAHSGRNEHLREAVMVDVQMSVFSAEMKHPQQLLEVGEFPPKRLEI